MMKPLIGRAVDQLRSARNVAALTGAGISIESGIPPFRGKGGLWERFDPMEVAHIDAFLADPARVWRVLFKELKEIIDRARPNDGHKGLARLEVMGILKTVITQNVDGLHAKAGSSDVLELHGNIWKLRCTREGTVEEVRESPLPVIPPVCSRCGALLRPHVVWFGEALDPAVLDRAFRLSAACRVMLVVGTSAVVHPAASLPRAAARAGAKVIEVNVEPTPLTPETDCFLPGRAGDILPLLDRRLREMRPGAGTAGPGGTAGKGRAS
jgi:NAD-dependent deacetylase